MATTSIDLTTPVYSLTVYKGRTWTAPYAFTELDETDPDNPVETPKPTTGWQLRGVFQKKGADVDLAETTFDRNDADGTGTYTIEGFDDLELGVYRFYIEYIDADGNKDITGVTEFKLKDPAP